MRVVNQMLPCFFRREDKRHVLCEGYEILMYANFAQKHEKSDGRGKKEEWKKTLFQADGWKTVGRKWPLEQRFGVERTSKRQICTAGECKARFEGRENVVVRVRRPILRKIEHQKRVTLRERAVRWRRVQDPCQPVFLGEVHLTPCHWDQYLELKQSAEDQYKLTNGILVPQAGMVGDRDHTQVIGELCSLIGRPVTGL